VRSAEGYVALAEQRNGPIPQPAEPAYIWGDALAAMDARTPDFRIINLETAVTRSEDYWPGKGINYRMNPRNISCLQAARIDACSLANNHVLDWGYAGFIETLHTLRRVGIKTCGAGKNRAEAEAPAVMPARERHRILVFSFGIETSGIPFTWAAHDDRPGVNWLPDLSEPSIRRVADVVERHRTNSDIIIVSIHWGGNWGYDVLPGEQFFAQQLIDRAGVDVVHGHSSHHAKGIEVHRDRLILYGCGDFLTDYEGISGYEHFRGDLSLMYFADVEPTSGRLVRLQMVPLQMRGLQLRRASREDVKWLSHMLTREGKPFGTHVNTVADDTLALEWGRSVSRNNA
jgi:poly-gamma-glutamate synthesis protein (capsule biosynthesis protein)